MSSTTSGSEFRGKAMPGALGTVWWLTDGRANIARGVLLGLVAYGLIERQREGLGLSFYQCRRRLIAGKLSLDLSPLLPVQVEAA